MLRAAGPAADSVAIMHVQTWTASRSLRRGPAATARSLCRLGIWRRCVCVSSTAPRSAMDRRGPLTLCVLSWRACYRRRWPCRLEAIPKAQTVTDRSIDCPSASSTHPCVSSLAPRAAKRRRGPLPLAAYLQGRSPAAAAHAALWMTSANSPTGGHQCPFHRGHSGLRQRHQ